MGLGMAFTGRRGTSEFSTRTSTPSAVFVVAL